MTSETQSLGGGVVTDEAGATAASPAAPPASELPGVADPREESVRAIEQTRKQLHEAVAALDTGDDEQLGHAYERAAECADHIGRALWFLRRLQREREAAGR